MVTKRGKPKAVLVSFEEWERLQKRAPRSIKEMLLAPEPRFDLELPLRGEFQRRKPVAFE